MLQVRIINMNKEQYPSNDIYYKIYARIYNEHKGKQSKLVSEQYKQQAIYKSNIRYEHKNKCVNAITNKRYVHGIRSP